MILYIFVTHVIIMHYFKIMIYVIMKILAQNVKIIKYLKKIYIIYKKFIDIKYLQKKITGI